MILRIIQGKQGFAFGGPKEVMFSIDIKGINYEIKIYQCQYREINITSLNNINNEGLYSVYYSLESLLMLLEGQFYPIVHAYV